MEQQQQQQQSPMLEIRNLLIQFQADYEKLLANRNALEEECKKYKDAIIEQCTKIKGLSEDIDKIKAEFDSRKTEVVVKQEKQPEPEQIEQTENVEETAKISILDAEAAARHPASVTLFIEIQDDSVIVSTAFSPDGLNLAIGADKVLRIYNFEIDSFILGEKVGTSENKPSHVRSISWSPDSTRVICGVEDNCVYIFKVDPHGSCLERKINVSDQHLFQVLFLPDGKRFATSSGCVQIWDVDTAQKLSEFTRSTEGTAIAISLSPDQKTLAVGYDDKEVAFWDIESGKQIFSKVCHDDGVYNILFTLDGKRLITSSLDKTIKIWDITEGGLELSKTLDKHTDLVLTLAMDPKGEWLVSGSKDLSCIISHIQEGKMLYKLTNHENSVMAVSFNPNGKQFCTGSGDKFVKIWNFMTE